MAAVLLSMSVLGCGATDRPAPGRAAASTAPVVGPAAFDRVVAAEGTVTINVHTPTEGGLAGTDLAIPFDQVARQRDRLPSRDVLVAVYCRSGRMSTIARKTLNRMGFGRVVELRGGMRAWQASGRPLRKGNGLS